MTGTACQRIVLEGRGVHREVDSLNDGRERELEWRIIVDIIVLEEAVGKVGSQYPTNWIFSRARSSFDTAAKELKVLFAFCNLMPF